jgi:hypothetical protein
MKTITLNNGDGTFTESFTFGHTSKFSWEWMVDINHDGFPDIQPLDMLPRKVLKASLGMINA